MADGFLIEVPYRERSGRGRYWRPERSGYALSAVTAGVYSKEEAEEICRGVDYDLKPVPDPLGREPGEVIDLGRSWNDDPMLYAYQAGRGQLPSGTLLRLTGKFTPRGERGPSDPEEIVVHINDNFINYWSGCGGLRLEVVGQERPDHWKCTGVFRDDDGSTKDCTWSGPKPFYEGYYDGVHDERHPLCPFCHSEVEEVGS